MKIKEFIEKAIQGEWEPEGFEKGPCTCFQNPPCGNCENEEDHIFDFAEDMCIEQILLDPLAWQAVGKIEKWEYFKCTVLTCNHEYDMQGMIVCPKCKHHGAKETWIQNMMLMVIARVNDKSIEEFLKTL